MRQPLSLHPQSPCAAIDRLEVEPIMAPAGLLLRYVARGRIAEVKVARLSAPQRTDGLWKTTCFEAFLGSNARSDYYEFNFAPSTEWAAWRFTAYREGMVPALDADEPHIQTRIGANRLQVEAMIDVRAAQAFPKDGHLRLALCAVIEETSGALSYWALAHPRGKPDFHHRDGFILELTEKP